MTFSLVGMCRRTGMLGAAVTTSSIAVGNRCPFARAGVGAVLTQHRTDPCLGPRGLDLLASGLDATATIRALTDGTPEIGWRQLAVVDANGGTAFFNGADISSVHAAAQADACCAVGNIIRDEAVPRAMVDAFAAAPEAALGERLLRGLEAGLAAGGEWKQIKSAALLVVHEHPFPYVDLRVDLDPRPLERLRFLWELYAPHADLFARRATEPGNVPVPPI